MKSLESRILGYDEKLSLLRAGMYCSGRKNLFCWSRSLRGQKESEAFIRLCGCVEIGDERTGSAPRFRGRRH